MSTNYETHTGQNFSDEQMDLQAELDWMDNLLYPSDFRAEDPILDVL